MTELVERSRWLEPIEEFVAAHGREPNRWAIACTYQLDPERLVRSLLPVLSRRGCAFRTVVLADARALEQALGSGMRRWPGALNLHGVRVAGRGIFHPKLVLLRAGNYSTVCFGSANITSGGFGSNLELWTKSDDAEVVAGCAHFLSLLGGTRAVQLEPAARRSISRALKGLAPRAVAPVWSSLGESFQDRLRSGPEAKAKRCTVVSPLYASPGGLKRAREALPARHVDLYTNMATSLAGGAVYSYAPLRGVDDDGEEAGAPPEPGALHAKAYAFHSSGREGALLWMGSANFTSTALTRIAGSGGNVELMIRAGLPGDEWSDFARDLDQRFARIEGGRPEQPPKEEFAKPGSNVLGCELAHGKHGAVLLVQAAITTGSVVLVNDQGIKVRVEIKRGSGRVEGKELARLLPLATSTDLLQATVLSLWEQVGKKRFPVLVNVPHVPSVEAGAGGTLTLDALLDDLWGRVRVNRLADEDESDDEDAGAEPEGPEAEPDELEGRLDETKHQGALDKLAVRTMVLKRLLKRLASGALREALFAEARKELLGALPAHLKSTAQEYFRS